MIMFALFNVGELAHDLTGTPGAPTANRRPPARERPQTGDYAATGDVDRV